MQRLNVAILGHGFAGKLLEDVIVSSVPELRVTAVADPNPEKVRGLSRKYKVFQNYDALLAAHTPDALIVALPKELRRDSVQKVIARRMPMFLEKPLAGTLEDAAHLVGAVRASNVPCMAGMIMEFHPEFSAAYDAIDKRRIGDIASVEERINFDLPQPLIQSYLSQTRAVGEENGFHTFYRFQRIAQSRITRLDGLTKSNRHFGMTGEDYVAGIAVAENGMRMPFSLRWSGNHGKKRVREDYVCTVTGTKGIIVVEGFKQCTLIQGSKETVLYRHNLRHSFARRHSEGMKAQMRAFSDFLRSGKREYLLQPALDAQRAVELIYAQD